MIYIIGEQFQGEIMPITIELIGEGCRLAADRKEAAVVVLLGETIAEEAAKLLTYPIDSVICLEHPCLRSYSAEQYKKALLELIRAKEPSVVLIGATSYGREYAPALAALLQTGVVTDCQAVYQDEETGRMMAVRPAFDGKQMSVYQIPNTNPQIFTFRPGVLGKAQPAGKGAGTVKVMVPELTEEQNGPKILRYLPKKEKEVNLKEANIIVAGGRGMKGPEGFEVLEQLAAALGGEVAGTRPCVDAGWIVPAQQVGQTGLTVRPDLYLAFGISGAIQHTTGFTGSRYVIGINNNPQAVLFRYCDYGIVGDAQKVARAILSLLNEWQL